MKPEENIVEGATYFDMDNDAHYRYENGKWNKKWPLERKIKKEESMVYTKIAIRQVQSPEIGNKIYYQKNAETDCFEPCIVEDGQYFADNGRLSNAWTWLNLLTGERESGYGCFLEIVEQDEV